MSNAIDNDATVPFSLRVCEAHRYRWGKIWQDIRFGRRWRRGKWGWQCQNCGRVYSRFWRWSWRRNERGNRRE